MLRLPDFTLAYGNVALDQADVDIRDGGRRWKDIVSKPLFEESILPLANQAFIREYRLKQPEKLLEVLLIQSNVGVVQWSD